MISDIALACRQIVSAMNAAMGHELQCKTEKEEILLL